MAHTEAHSYVRGTMDLPLSDLTIAALRAETATRFPNRLDSRMRQRWAQLDAVLQRIVASERVTVGRKYKCRHCRHK
jgi:hypothetical protein